FDVGKAAAAIDARLARAEHVEIGAVEHENRNRHVSRFSAVPHAPADRPARGAPVIGAWPEKEKPRPRRFWRFSKGCRASRQHSAVAQARTSSMAALRLS